MDFPKDEHQNLPAIEREHSRLVDEFTTNLPPPQTPSSTDRSLIIKFLNAAPLLTTFQKRGLQRFLANVGVMNDGRVVITITSILAQPKFMVLGWGSEFGACLRLLLPTAKTPTQAVFIPGDNPFEALHSNRIILCCYRLGRIHSMQEFRIDASEKACKALEQLIAMCIQDDAEILALDRYLNDANLIRANSVSVKYFSSHWTRLEWLQRGWINDWKHRSYHIIAWIKEAAEDISEARKLPLLCRYELLQKILTALDNGTISTSAKIVAALVAFKSSAMNQLAKELISLDQDTPATQTNTPLRRVGQLVYSLWELLELDAELSDWGQLQVYWDPSGETVPPIVIDVENFAIEKPEDAALYWEQKLPGIIANRASLLSASDLQIDPKLFVQGFSRWQPVIDELEAKQAIEHLLNEATALREWSIPPNAFIELEVGPFIGAELTEIGNDVYFVWRTITNRYWVMSVNTEQHFAQTQIVFRKDPEDEKPSFSIDAKAQLAIELIMSAVIRDFWVVTERQKVFGVKRHRSGRSSVAHDRRRVVYLPRIRYIESRFNLPQLSSSLSYKTRSQHYVRPFFRKAKASALQIEIARRARVEVPKAHTYVRGHYRGVEQVNRQTIYRSRSALALLFESDISQVDTLDNFSTSDWFEFERGIAILLERHFGFKIEHRAVRGKTDCGIDILATKVVGSQLETWVVQCKCYKASNPVKPSHMRELIGSIADLGIHDSSVRGMVVTTSDFTGDALRLGIKHGIQCVSGDDLTRVLSSINIMTGHSPNLSS